MTMGNAARQNPPQAGQVRRGGLHSPTLALLFHHLDTTRATGVLTVENGPILRRIEFDKGHVLFASSNDRDDRLNQILLRADVISLKNLMRALEVSLATRDRLGEVLVRAKLMTPDTVERWVKTQVRQIICGAFGWTAGQFAFEEKPVQADPLSLNVRADAMLIEGVKSIGSWARVYDEVGGLNTEYLATRDAASVIHGLPLLKEERELLGQCKSPTSLEEMCEQSRLKDYDVCKSVWALLLVGALMKS